MSDAERDPGQLDEFAAELAAETDEKFEDNREKQDEFLDTVAEEEGAEVLETKCNLVGDYTVPIKAKLDGELMDAMGRIDGRLERLGNEDARAYEISETAKEVSNLLADVIDDDEWHASMFYEAYENEGLQPLGGMLERAFEALKDERERRQGVADGFRQNE